MANDDVRIEKMSSGLTVVEQDGESSRPLIASLFAAVYPPEALAIVPWRDVRSARSQRRVLVLNQEATVIAAAGLLVREAKLDDHPVVIGGIGGVMTMPSHQGQGIGRIEMEAVAAVMEGFKEMSFAVLFCEPKNIGFYTELGWQLFEGSVEIQQESGKKVYDIMQTMVRSVHGVAPRQGRLDLCGLPW